MVLDPDSNLIAGETRADLLLALSYFQTTEPSQEGRMSFTGDVPGDVALPLVRALKRIEAQQLLREADLVDVGEGPRSLEERQGAALAELIDSLAATAG
ncbi:hypothetical protein Lesp02_20300 [Lentzea sp. NBRC 105346]|uniref:hypothetical protein n=1 Tax=Lentzea sp. NBRC 105346 TaxID=3032205 RepID=UPI0024A06655|nr:hypothetical protein [Lentzea sp. NBRC 105346]GLZ29840.1 hypothetical protein Lesp02_20300 [Lentzea sp. NBRC 105346]